MSGVNAMRCNLGFHPDMAQGYGRMGTMIARELAHLGVELLGGIHYEPGTQSGAYVNPEATAIAPVALWCSTPPHVKGWYRGQTAALFSMWEGDQIPPGFRENLSSFDRVFVPCEQNRALYANFHPDVRTIPLGVDPDVWAYQPRRPVDALGTRGFNFLTGGAGPRKNCALVVKAFRRVFGKVADAHLTILAGDAHEHHGERIHTISQKLSNEAEVSVYANAHCFVSGSYAEGWGLMPNQAIAQGIPTILGDAHGHAEFAKYGIPLDTKLVKAAAPGTFFGDNGQWWEPDFDQMCEAMWDVYQNYPKYEFQAELNAYACAGEFNWKMTAAKLIYNLPTLWADAPAEPEWFSAPPRLYQIRVMKPEKFVINGRVYIFKPWDGTPDTEYWEPADLKMRLGEKGNLHPSVINPHDMGVEAAAIARVRADEATCPTCGQLLNTNRVPLGV